MREIGGYFELETFHGTQYHKNAIALNCGRGCIRYLAELRRIKKIWIPDYICDSVPNTFRKSGAEVKTYEINKSFLPVYNFEVKDDEWMLLNDYYGQLKENDIAYAKDFSKSRLICDENQGFFRRPHEGVDTFYSCRKWFGVADGGFLITGDGARLDRELPKDKSHNRMSFVLGRYEASAQEFYREATKNNAFFDEEPSKQMSMITENLLRAIDYDAVMKRRKEHWDYLDNEFCSINQLKLHKPYVSFMYPLLLKSGYDACDIRKKLAEKGIYIPLLWPCVSDKTDEKSFANKYAKNILPLPVDQRYLVKDMNAMITEIKKIIEN